MAAIFAVAPPTSVAGELQWRRVRTVAMESSPGNPLRFSRSRAVAPRTDEAVIPAKGEEVGPQFSADAGAADRFRSVIVSRDEASETMRSAQLPPSGAATDPADAPSATDPAGAPSATDLDSQLEEKLRNPFAPPPEDGLEPRDTGELEVDTMPLSEEDALEPEPTQQQQLDLPPLPPMETGPRVLPERAAPLLPSPDALPAPTADKIEAERELARQACSQGLEDVRAKTIDKLDLTIAVTGTEGSDFPFECSLDEGASHPGRSWEQTTYLWKASALCHKPLYFEDEQLERYGHSFPPCFQPFVSGAHFFTRLPILPYCMGVEPPYECIYALGHYRPGNCAPYMCNPVPLSVRGGLIQAGAVVGTAAALP